VLIPPNPIPPDIKIYIYIYIFIYIYIYVWGGEGGDNKLMNMENQPLVVDEPVEFEK
jgi:hypothetical protein